MEKKLLKNFFSNASNSADIKEEIVKQRNDWLTDYRTKCMRIMQYAWELVGLKVAFRTLPNIYDWAFCWNSYRPKAKVIKNEIFTIEIELNFLRQLAKRVMGN